MPWIERETLLYCIFVYFKTKEEEEEEEEGRKKIEDKPEEKKEGKAKEWNECRTGVDLPKCSEQTKILGEGGNNW